VTASKYEVIAFVLYLTIKKEFEVIKINSRGKRQERILGID